MEIIGGQGILEEFPGGAALLTAGVQNRTDTGISLSAHQRTVALCDPSIDDQLPDTLLPTMLSDIRDPPL